MLDSRLCTICVLTFLRCCRSSPPPRARSYVGACPRPRIHGGRELARKDLGGPRRRSRAASPSMRSPGSDVDDRATRCCTDAGVGLGTGSRREGAAVCGRRGRRDAGARAYRARTRPEACLRTGTHCTWTRNRTRSNVADCDRPRRRVRHLPHRGRVELFDQLMDTKLRYSSARAAAKPAVCFECHTHARRARDAAACTCENPSQQRSNTPLSPVTARRSQAVILSYVRAGSGGRAPYAARDVLQPYYSAPNY
ncbi:hypothetical protein BD413DRAFT_283318 [Trametes elegans]|nr:hypothetical protein BD413DRAFT_283318 [Trametes elegans]